MTRDEVLSLLDGILEKEMGSLDTPSPSEWFQLEKKFGCQFPKEFKYFIDLMSEYVFPGDILNASSGNTNGNDTIEFTYDYERKQGFLKEELIPFYSVGNGDYFCLNSTECPDTGVYYYSYEDHSTQKEAGNFDEWLKELPNFLK